MIERLEYQVVDSGPDSDYPRYHKEQPSQEELANKLNEVIDELNEVSILARRVAVLTGNAIAINPATLDDSDAMRIGKPKESANTTAREDAYNLGQRAAEIVRDRAAKKEDKHYDMWDYHKRKLTDPNAEAVSIEERAIADYKNALIKLIEGYDGQV